MFMILASSWLCNVSKIRPQFYRLENFAKKTDIHMSGSAVQKTTVDQAGEEKYMQNG